ncbi:hypothetical protein ABW20_dc0108749 [Dactylellina cionopaga]|nr:hypothetical protein ABW20_dc0108749 [Dactylellina cionopaga]
MSAVGWFWEIGESRFTPEGHTLIQITGGPDAEEQPGITHSIYEPNARLYYGYLQEGKIIRSQFRVKRRGAYQNFDALKPVDATLKVGDILEFWGPSPPNERQLYIQNWINYLVGDPLYTIVRQTASVKQYGQQPPVEFHVADLGFNEIVTKYSRYEEEEVLEDVQLIEEETRKEEGRRKPKSKFCGLGGICQAAVRGIRQVFGGQKQQDPKFNGIDLNFDSSPMGDATTDPFSSHRHLRSPSRAESRENSIFIPRIGESDYGADIVDDIFEPRVPNLPKNSIFKPTRLAPGDVETILRHITEAPRGEDEFTIYTEEKDGTPQEGIFFDNFIDETIPEELVGDEPKFSIGNLETPQFGVEQAEQEGIKDEEEPKPQGQQGELELPLPRLMLQSPRSPGIMAPMVQLDNIPTMMQSQSEKRYNAYVRCVRRFVENENGEPDEEIAYLVEHGWGLYSPMDFDEARIRKQPPPPCPTRREDIIDRAEAQGYPRYVPPGATGANPQSGVGYT